MGVWGTGLTQSDEFCEVYDSFMEKYDAGESIDVITDEILNGYLSEFDAENGILHDVYFALAKCQWMCGALSESVMNTVKDVIQNGKTWSFLKSWGQMIVFCAIEKRNWINFFSPWKYPEIIQGNESSLPKKGICPLPTLVMYFRIKVNLAYVLWWC